MSRLETDSPNWQRFLQKYPEFRKHAESFEARYERMPESEEKTKLAKLVNLELGMALLREVEIDREAFSKMLSAISK